MIPVDPAELAAGLLNLALETMMRASQEGCISIAHRLDMAALQQTDKNVRNAYLRMADACRQVAISKDPGAVERWRKTRHKTWRKE